MGVVEASFSLKRIALAKCARLQEELDDLIVSA